MYTLTHIQLSDETGHVVVLVVQRQYFASELRLILYDETFAILPIEEGREVTMEIVES